MDWQGKKKKRKQTISKSNQPKNLIHRETIQKYLDDLSSCNLEVIANYRTKYYHKYNTSINSMMLQYLINLIVINTIMNKNRSLLSTKYDINKRNS